MGHNNKGSLWYTTRLGKLEGLGAMVHPVDTARTSLAPFWQNHEVTNFVSFSKTYLGYAKCLGARSHIISTLPTVPGAAQRVPGLLESFCFYVAPFVSIQEPSVQFQGSFGAIQKYSRYEIKAFKASLQECPTVLVVELQMKPPVYEMLF